MTRRRLTALLAAAAIAGNLAPIHLFAATPTITLQPGESVTIVAATPAPTASPAPASPSQSPSVSPAPSPSVACASLQGRIDATPAGGTVDFGTCVYTSAATVSKPLTLRGGTIRQPGTGLTITGSDVTVDGTRFEGGAFTIRISGDRIRIANSTFTGMTETSIRMDNAGSDDVTIEGNTITQPSGVMSPISARDSDAAHPNGGLGVGAFKRMTIRGNTIHNGPGTPGKSGPYGVEVWGVANLLIEGNTFDGVGALMSLPRSDGAIVRNNTLNPGWYWGIELADVSDAQVTGNTVTGSGKSLGPDGRAFVQLHPGSGTSTNVTITGNRVTAEWALLNAAGSGHTITDNCGDWTKLYAVTGPAPAGDFMPGTVTIARNGAC